MAFGRHSFTLNREDADGVTRRSQLEIAYQQTGILPEELTDEPHLPWPCRAVWEWFGELAAARQSGFGANPISFFEIDAWSRLTGTRLMPWEVRALRALDTEILHLSNAEQKAKAKNGH